jgi:hypothetical protein
MSDTTVVVEAEPEPEVTVVDTGGEDDAVDAVELAVEIQLVERITRLEESHNTLVAVVAGLTDQIQGMQMTDEIQQAEIEQTQEAVVEVATEAADAVQETVEEVEQASEEIKPDEVPTVREHPFFRKWGKR